MMNVVIKGIILLRVSLLNIFSYYFHFNKHFTKYDIKIATEKFVTTLQYDVRCTRFSEIGTGSVVHPDQDGSEFICMLGSRSVIEISFVSK
jgi:hypothetical protein